MNLDLMEVELPEALLSIILEIETYCGFEIKMEVDRFLRARGMLTSGPTWMVLKVKCLPPDLAVVAHELCHARRYYNQKTWMMRFVPTRFFGTGERQRDAAEDLDNVLEHLVILQELQDEFGIAKTDSHVVEDLDSLDQEKDGFLRRSILLTSWLLSNYHFPHLIDRAKWLLEKENLSSTAARLLSDSRQAGLSKAKLIAAFVRAIGIPEDEVELRYRDPKANGYDVGALLSTVLAVESARERSSCPTAPCPPLLPEEGRSGMTKEEAGQD
jgi:hypothetical protein